MKLGFIGAGNMASAIIGGIIKKGIYTPKEIICSTPVEAERKKALLLKLRKGPDLDRFIEEKKRRYTSYAGGARIYSMSYYTFIKQRS